MAAPKMTLPTQLVLHALMQNPDREMYGLEICSVAGLPSGTIHPMLVRLEKAGWLRSRWEETDPSQQGRPRRRYFRLNPDSIATVRSALHRAEASTRALTNLRPGIAGGTP